MVTLSDVKVHVLFIALMKCDQTWRLLKPGSRIKLHIVRDDPVLWTQSPMRAVLIEHPAVNLVWDIGTSRDWQSRQEPTGLDEYRPVSKDPIGPNYLGSSLDVLGFAPTDINILAPSHLYLHYLANARDSTNDKTESLVNGKEIAGGPSVFAAS